MNLPLRRRAGRDRAARSRTSSFAELNMMLRCWTASSHLTSSFPGCQIPSQTLNLDMIVASYDDGEIALIHQLCQVTMRKVNQRAGGIFQGKPCFSCLFTDTLGHALSCDEDCPFIGLIGAIYELDAGLMEPILNYWIVCQGSKNVQFSFLG